MAGEEIQLGPFVGGLNTYSDPTAISDTSLAEIVNFEMDEDGALTNRPPFKNVPVNLPGADTGGGAVKILGFYSLPDGTNRLIASNGRTATYYFTGTSWVQIVATPMNAVVQYRDELWMVSDTVCGKWSPSGGWSADANMPTGTAIIAHKDRLWVVPGKNAATNGSRLYMSTIVSALVSWPATKVFINVGAGDGQNIVDLAVYNADIVIFKERSTYRFSFMADPARGELRRISSTIGIADVGCYSEHENSIYLLFANKVYLFVNYNFEELNSKVPLKAKSFSESLTQNTSLSIWADRLVVQFYDMTYVFKLKTRTWSVWESKLAPLKYIGRFWTIPSRVVPSAYLASSEKNRATMYEISDEISTTAEDMVCRITTKNYDYDTPSRFKRLFYWGVDVIANVTLTLEVKPINYGRRATWGEMSAFTWGMVSNRTWGQPLDPVNSISEVIPVGGLSFGRKFVKALKTLRFRQVAFVVEGSTNGDTLTSPLKVFSITTYVSDKQSVSKKIS